MKQEDKLKEAFSSVAMEQPEQLEKSLTYEERRKSEALYKHHHDTSLRLIRKQKVSIVKWVSGIAAVAAAVLLIVWGVNRPAPDIITPATAPVSTVVSAYETWLQTAIPPSAPQGHSGDQKVYTAAAGFQMYCGRLSAWVCRKTLVFRELL